MSKKMADVFKLPVRIKHIGQTIDCEWTEAIEDSEKRQLTGHLPHSRAEAICLAVNEYDNLKAKGESLCQQNGELLMEKSTLIESEAKATARVKVLEGLLREAVADMNRVSYDIDLANRIDQALNDRTSSKISGGHNEIRT